MTRITSPFTIDTSCVTTVTEVALKIVESLDPSADKLFISQLFTDCDNLFSGRHPDYQANDLPYHDFQHTLQVSAAFIDLFIGRQKSAASPPFSHRHFELGLAATLFHDTGYLKLRSDRDGTGAKYTFCHVLRSCAFAASHLPTRGLKMEELDIVLGAIRCTGPSTTGMNLRFNRKEDHELASMVATADYLGQMAADDYPDELGLLFQEFAESDAFRGLPAPQRLFKSASHLAGGSTLFWEKVVKPKFENDFLGVYRFLNLPDGSNRYIDKIEHNLEVIAQRHAATIT